MRLRFILFICIFYFIAISIVSDEKSNVDLINPDNFRENNSSYTNHEPIIIRGNEDFIETGWLGTGTKQDPFVIQELEITSEGCNIRISHTTAYFRISSCILNSNSGCLRLYNVSNGIIELSTLNSTYDGIELRDTSYCSISSCIINTSSNGIIIYDSFNCTIENNTISSVGTDLLVEDSVFCNFIGNSMIGQGLLLEGENLDQWTHEIADNTINSKPIGYLVEEENISISPDVYGQVFLLKCKNVSFVDFYYRNVSVGISLAGHRRDGTHRRSSR